MDGTIEIGIVDDHEIYKKGLKLALSYFDDLKILLEAENGRDLLIQLKVSTPQVILLDLKMSIMDGITVLPLLKHDFPQVKVIMLSIYDDIITIEKLRNLGADSFLSKNCDVRKMYEEIKSVANNDFKLRY